MLRCKACGGLYDRRQPDGSRYMHVCPPDRWFLVANPDGTVERVAPADQKDRIVLREEWTPRVNGRDERPASTRGAAPGAIVAEGSGTEAVTITDTAGAAPATQGTPS